MTELQITRCNKCGTTWFPERLRCSICGSVDFKRIPAGEGEVEQKTTVRAGVRLASVRLDAGPIVIARLNETTKTGARVRLEQDATAAIRAHRAHRPKEGE